MRVESFTSTNGLTRYILVDTSGVPVDVVLRFLRFKDNCGRARNTLRAYCFHLKSYFEYLEFIGMSFCIRSKIRSDKASCREKGP